MLFAEARRPARRDSAGRYVPLGEQDLSLWDAGMIEEAETRLRARRRAVGSRSDRPLPARGRGAGGACGAAADRPHGLGRTGDALRRAGDVVGGSPVVTINRAVAIAETVGPQAALAELDAIADDKRLVEYQPYWAARAGLLARLGDAQAARASL